MIIKYYSLSFLVRDDKELVTRMDEETQIKLKKLLADGEMINDNKNGILEILGKVSEVYTVDDLIASNKGIPLLNKPKLTGSLLSSDLAEELVRNHTWLLPYRIFLQPNYDLDDTDLLHLIKQDNTESSSLSKRMIKKLLDSQETRSSLLKMRSIPLSENLSTLCQKYPSLTILRAATWQDINKQIKTYSPLTPSEVLWVKELWSFGSLMRQKILKDSLPMELVDELEQNNLDISCVQNASDEKFTEMCGILSPNEKTVFKKWRQKATATKDTSEEQSVGKTLQANRKIKREFQAYQEKSFPSQVTEELNNAGWQNLQDINPSGKEELDLLQNTSFINIMPEATKEGKFSRIASMTQLYEADEELIFKISGGIALHGVCFGIDAANLCKPASLLLLEKEKIRCDMKEPSLPSSSRSEYFVNKQEGMKFTKTITDTGFNFGFDLRARRYGIEGGADVERQKTEVAKSANSEERESNNVTMINFHIFPMAAYRIDRGQMEFSPDAIKDLQDIKNVDNAERFLEQYGSYIPCGLNHVGGILCHSAEVSNTQQLKQENTLKMTENQLNGASSVNLNSLGASIGGNFGTKNNAQDKSYSMDQTSDFIRNVEFFFHGPNKTNPKEFEETLKRNRQSWRIIDRGDIPNSLVPIWSILFDKHPNLKQEANLLCEAWLRISAKCEFDLLVKREREMVERNFSNSDDAKLEDRILELGKLDLEVVEQGHLLEKLESFFNIIEKLELKKGAPPPTFKTEDPWVLYVAKQPKMREFLRKMADKKQEYQNKFSRVYGYLSRTIDISRLQKIEEITLTSL